MSPATHAVPLPTTAVDLLRRADGELLAAQLSQAPAETFTHAHLAALRAAAAVVAVRGRPGGRRPPRTVWDMLAAVAPEAAPWATFFAAGASLRLAVDAGRFDAVDAEHAERTLSAAEDFLDEVRALLEQPAAAGTPVARPLRALRAS
jgi:hypothetical protein